MAIPIEGRLRWRETAPIHVQLKLENTGVALRVPSEIRIGGRVVRLFRTDGRVALDDHITFSIWVCRKGEEPTGPAYVYYDNLLQARYIEAYLYGAPPVCELAGYEFSIIDAPSDNPTLTIAELEHLIARILKRQADTPPTKRKRWKFWKD